MNEEKIDLILKGINLLIISNKDLDQDIKNKFNIEFFDAFNKTQTELVQERTKEVMSDDAKRSK